jgi:hypothetical protein
VKALGRFRENAAASWVKHAVCARKIAFWSHFLRIL